MRREERDTENSKKERGREMERENTEKREVTSRISYCYHHLPFFIIVNFLPPLYTNLYLLHTSERSEHLYKIRFIQYINVHICLQRQNDKCSLFSETYSIFLSANTSKQGI